MRFAALAVALLFTVPTASAQTNPITDGVALWLRADAGITLDTSGRVASWQDQSSEAYEFTGVSESQRPTLEPGALNGRSVVRFDGTDDFLSGGDILDDVITGGGATFSLFAVLLAEETAGDSQTFFAKGAALDNLRQYLFRVYQAEPHFFTYYNLSSSSTSRGSSGDFEVFGVPHVYRFGYDGSRTGGNGLERFDIGIDGAPDGSRLVISRGGLGNIQDGPGPLGLGAWPRTNGSASQFFRGDIAELILYDRLLDPIERGTVEGYLGAKYGVPVGPVDLTATPLSPLTVAAGGSIQFQYDILNGLSASVSGSLSFAARFGGNVVAEGAIRAGTVLGDSSVTSTFTQQVPATAPAGDYLYTLAIESVSGDIVDTITFTVTVTAPTQASKTAGDGWTVTAATPWHAPEAASATAQAGAVITAAPFPNPFARQTSIPLVLDEARRIAVEVFDVTGRRVALLHDGLLPAGAHDLTLDAVSLPSGTYFVRTTSEQSTNTQRIVLVR